MIEDLSNPEIELIYPSDNPSLSLNLPLCIKAVITDDQRLSSLSWDILESASGSLKMHQQITIPSFRNAIIDENIRLDEHLRGNYIFRITAVDGAGNTSKLTLPFNLHQ